MKIPIEITLDELNKLDQNPKIRDLTLTEIIKAIANKKLEVIKRQ
jgi:hypothetical protein